LTVVMWKKLHDYLYFVVNMILVDRLLKLV